MGGYTALYAFDISKEKIELVRKDMAGQNNLPFNVQIKVSDINKIDLLPGMLKVNKIVTDPPWGLFDDISDISQCYTLVIKQFVKISQAQSVVILLTARKLEFESALKIQNIEIIKKYNILVSGKKAAIYKFVLN